MPLRDYTTLVDEQGRPMISELHALSELTTHLIWRVLEERHQHDKSIEYIAYKYHISRALVSTMLNKYASHWRMR